jgi:hypothetical protein
MGQWSQGGMIMIGDMFNNGLKYRVDSLCNDLTMAMQNNWPFAPVPMPPAAPAGQSQSQSSGGPVFPPRTVSGAALGTAGRRSWASHPPPDRRMTCITRSFPRRAVWLWIRADIFRSMIQAITGSRAFHRPRGRPVDHLYQPVRAGQAQRLASAFHQCGKCAREHALW